MRETQKTVDDLIASTYEHGFVTDIESDTVPPGLSEDTIRMISAKKSEPEWLLAARLKAYRHWLTMVDPGWAHVKHPEIDFQAISYYSAPRKKGDGPKSLDEVDPQLLDAYNKLGIPLDEQMALAGIAVDAVFDSVSVATTFRKKLADTGVIFCAMSEAVREYPELVQKYLGSVVPHTDNYFAG
ncbi:MAG: Fe-S cluster assembly protein SufB, partial [Gammaproteobacteria bacterium]